jgi:hypothetical protein
MPFVSHAAWKGYNDVMWTEIEHRHGKGTRQRVEKVRRLLMDETAPIDVAILPENIADGNAV